MSFKYIRKRSKFLQSVSSYLFSPFSQFLDLTDLAEYDPAAPRNRTPKWKRKFLKYGSLLQTLIWISDLIHEFETDGWTMDAALISANGVAWVSPPHTLSLSNLHVLNQATISYMFFRYPPKTSPYLLTLFLVFHSISATVDLISELNSPSPYKITTIFKDALRLVLCSNLSWTAGSLPMRDILPCNFVAHSEDVSKQIPTTPSFWS